MIPRENLFFWAGIIAGIFLLGWLLHGAPADADTHAAAQARQELRRDLAAAKACGPGHAALWIDPATVECRKEITP